MFSRAFGLLGQFTYELQYEDQSKCQSNTCTMLFLEIPSSVVRDNYHPLL